MNSHTQDISRLRIEKKNIVRIFIKTVLILEIVNLLFTSQVALAQNVDSGNYTIYSKPTLSKTWESARDGALIGFGSGAAISLIGYAAQSEGMDYGRILAGSTGTGFIVGAIYGFVEAKWMTAETDVGTYKGKFRPQIFENDGSTGVGLFAQFDF